MTTAIIIIYLLVALSVVVLMLKDHSNPAKAIAWMFVVLFIPLLGMVMYILVGRNLRNKRLFMGHLSTRENQAQLSAASITPAEGIFPEANQARLAKMLSEGGEAPLSFGNEVTLLLDGKETFESKFEAIRAAKHHIHLEYYIFEKGEVSQTLIDILCEKAAAGVEVRLMFDDVGSWHLKDLDIECLRESGGLTNPFLPVRFPSFAQRFNYRNHRKILVIDGKVGFVGGLNITDKYFNKKGDEELYWRDCHLKLEGRAVLGLQNIFVKDWHFADKSPMLEGTAYFPEFNTNSGNQTVQIVSSGPDSQWASVMHAYFYAIVTAKEKVYLSTPYFIPNSGLTTALVTAAMAGLDVRMLIPQKSDSKLLFWSMRSFLEEFLAAGVRIFMYQPGINHGKTMCVDGEISSIGTANLDVRSFHQNFEVNAIIYSQEITQKVEQRFFEGLDDSEELLYEDFKKRPAREKFIESLARLMSPLL